MTTLRLRRLTLLAVCAATWACSKPPEDLCAGVQCRDSEVCDGATGLCVIDDPPVVGFTPPSVIKAHEITLSGRVTDDGGPLDRLELRHGEGSWIPLKVDAEGAFALTVEVPELDGQQGPV